MYASLESIPESDKKLYFHEKHVTFTCCILSNVLDSANWVIIFK